MTDIEATNFKIEYIKGFYEELFEGKPYCDFNIKRRFNHYIEFKKQGSVIQNYVVSNIFGFVQFRVLKVDDKYCLRIDSNVKDLKTNDILGVDFDSNYLLAEDFESFELNFEREMNKDHEIYELLIGGSSYICIRNIFCMLDYKFKRVGQDERSGYIQVLSDSHDLSFVEFDGANPFEKYSIVTLEQPRNNIMYPELDAWCRECESQGIIIEYAIDCKNRIHVYAKDSDFIERFEVPQFVYELNCRVKCDTLVIPECDEFVLSSVQFIIPLYKHLECNAEHLFILDGCFDGASDIESVKCRKVSVGKRAFMRCYNLKYFECSGVVSVGKHAFDGCSNLISFPFDKLLCDKIDDYAFTGCNSLTSLDLSREHEMFLGKGCFMNCENLKLVELSQVISLEDRVFKGCIGLSNVRFHKVNSLDENLFNTCGDGDLQIVFDKSEYSDRFGSKLGVLSGKVKKGNAIYASTKVVLV